MFDRRSDARQLMAELVGFLGHWMGESRIFGISPAKLEVTRLPQPLHWLYRHAGNVDADNKWRWCFSTQDTLLPFELLRSHNGRLLFAVENQGVWLAGTKFEGEDPPVWIDTRDSWKGLDCRLSEFLVTLCLQELMFQGPWLGHADNGEQACARFADAGCVLKPIWLDGPFPGGRMDFWLADDSVLICSNGWYGSGRHLAPKEAIAGLFQEECDREASDDTERIRTGPREWSEVELDRMPVVLGMSLLRFTASEHERFAAHHAQRAAHYLQLADRASAEWMRSSQRENKK